jgi:hypothetical protein
MRKVSAKSCRENQNTLLPDNRAPYEIMWKNTAEPETPQMTIWRMRFARWMTKATVTHFLLFHGNNGFANTSSIRYRHNASLDYFNFAVESHQILWFCEFQPVYHTSPSRQLHNNGELVE